MTDSTEQIAAPPTSQPSQVANPIPLPKGYGRVYRYYDLIMAGFVTVLICTNLISAPKRVEVLGFTFGAGVLFFPISYLFNDILTEVYGYKRSRKVVWAGFGGLAFATLVSQVVLALPEASDWGNQGSWEIVFGGTWRIIIASMAGFFAGEFINSYTLAKMKLWTEGRFLWMRTIGSTLTGEAADSLLFYPIAFLGRPGWTLENVLTVMVANYTLKVAWEVVATPMTYRVVGFLKRVESEDYYDRNTNFTPFSLET